MKTKNILIIAVVVIFLLVFLAVLSAGSMIVYAPVPVILSTIDFIGTESEFRDMIESTEEAKLFREAYPDAQTSYILEIGKRTMIFESDMTSHSVTLHFKQMFDRTVHVSYWCVVAEQENSLFGPVFSIDDLRESGCL